MPPRIDLSFQADIGGDAEDRIETNLPLNASLPALGLEGTQIDTPDNARAELGAIDIAIDRVAGLRAELGTLDRRLEAADGVFAQAKKLHLDAVLILIDSTGQG